MSGSMPTPTLTLRGGGWLIALTVALVCALLLWAFWGVIRGQHPVGDGTTLASYGFSLEPLKADTRFLVGSGMPRDFLPSMDAPQVMRGGDMLAYNKSERRVYVATLDRVAGVVVNGEARAYPLSVLNAHEVCNDTLGGVPIAVTYSPLTDSVAVFDRRVNGAEKPPVHFRVSGLLYNSNLVMYDASPVPSLWSQLGLRAIAGPAAARDQRLVPLPGVNIASWKMWLALHPRTGVIMEDPAFKQRYKELSYARYCMSPSIAYPVEGLQAERREPQSVQDALDAFARGDPPTRKTAAVRVSAGGSTALWTLPELLGKTGNQDGIWSTSLGGVPLTVATQREPLAVLVQSTNGEPVVVVPLLWFAHGAFGE